MMSFDLRILKVLSDGEFHSGEELGQLLGISRAAVWKQLQKLERVADLQLESVRGRGYRLGREVELLDRQKIAENVSDPAKSLLNFLNIIDIVDSTNRVAMDIALVSPMSGGVVLAEQQSAGRGRRGRRWISPFARNIYCSVIWTFDAGAAALEGLSLAVGVAVVHALATSGVHGTRLKWPNDIVYEQRKLAGILIEMTGDPSGECQVIIGIGINVAMRDVASDIEIDQPWTDVNTIAGKSISRNKLTANLIMHLLPLLRDFEVDGFTRFHEVWSDLDCAKGKPVAIHIGEHIVHGIAAGINKSGAFGVDTDRGREWFHGGEISLRLQI